MPWLLASPGHQQPWNCICRIYESLSSTRTSTTYSISVSSNDKICKDIFIMFPENKFSMTSINSLAPGRLKFRLVIFKPILMNGGWGISYEIALWWMPQDLTDDNLDKSTLVQVMAWCRQATSHYLSQCWPRSMSPNGVTRPQWVKYWFSSREFTEALNKIQGTESNASIISSNL